MSDCLWGLLDGMNDAGLAVSLTYGGRRVLGHGFGIPLVLRYLLETCDNVRRLTGAQTAPVSAIAHAHLADSTGDAVTAYLSPDRGVLFRSIPIATNHQGKVEWTEHAVVTQTVEREECILRMVDDPELAADAFVESFLRQPLYNTTYSRGFGTLYTAAYRPVEGQVEYLWPGTAWKHSFEQFDVGTHTESLVEQAVA